VNAVLPNLVVILRGLGTAEVLSAAEALEHAGVQALEVTLDSPDALASIEALAARPAGLLVGAGTARTLGDVARAADAGAAFLLSPHCDPDLIRATKERGLVSVPGAFTPTEIVAAHAAGADVVKVFPVHTVEPAYVRAVREPLPDVPLLACGGLTAQRSREFLAAGCVSVGVGLGLIDADAAAAGDWAALREGARRYLAELTP
jgi:2-dehydro-3-deoxyphosphogluconate aldolase/(4S)-4-hydroxy-2-oxoglutarate aldolase